MGDVQTLLIRKRPVYGPATGYRYYTKVKVRQSHHIQSVLPRVNNALAGSLFHLMASIGIQYAIFGGMRPCFQLTCFSSVAEQNREPSTAQKYREIRGCPVAVLRIS